MVRSRGARVGLGLMALLLALFVLAAVAGGRLGPSDELVNAALVTPTAFLVYAALSVVGPAAAGGGNELFPAEDVSPHPIRPMTRFVTSVLLAPLNIAWVTQSTALLALTSYVSASWKGLPATMTIAVLYILAVTVCGQAIAWWLIGVRQSRSGRIGTWVATGLLAMAVLVTTRLTNLTDLLDKAPTRPVVFAILDSAGGVYRTWYPVVAVLAVLVVAGGVAGVAAVAYTTRRPVGAAIERQARRVPRRGPARSLRAELLRIDRASVWRAGSLRRGVIVMGLLPGTATAAVRVDWTSLALAGGLVAAGAGLLFGVNAFCLDGSGGLWLGSLPLPASEHLLSKARVIAETCAVCCVITVAAGATRARGELTASAVATVVAAVVACCAVVVASCIRSSVDKPHRAELRGARDTPAPPGAMAGYSARLAIRTTLLAMIIAGTGATGAPWAPVALALAMSTLAWLSIRDTLHRFASPEKRSFVLVTVASG